MTAAQYRTALEKLGLNQSSAAEFFGVSLRTSARWAAIGPPREWAIIIRALIAGKISANDFEG